jgi:hypothetical protein
MPKQLLEAQETEAPTGDLHRLHELISQRAYEIFLSRGAAGGADLDDWFRAEQELAAETQAKEAGSAPGTGRDREV